ncbi:MAG TPA: hypothetical protein VI727_01165, partial [Candidatus Brocadiaceae bacterium]|nr:hypothetical protein [Candidatus Brocadiaceae bacterium]
IMIHAVWGTKHREPYLTKDIMPSIVSHIKENARSKEIFIDTSRIDIVDIISAINGGVITTF